MLPVSTRRLPAQFLAATCIYQDVSTTIHWHQVNQWVIGRWGGMGLFLGKNGAGMENRGGIIDDTYGQPYALHMPYAVLSPSQWPAKYTL